MRVAIDTDFLVRLSIAGHPGRSVAAELRDRHLAAGDRFALAPQVAYEFVHVVTDPRRFTEPLAMTEALRVARAWWEGAEVDPLLPEDETVPRFFELMAKHQLGRKRVLDTALASACLAAEVTHLITGNADAYRVFPELVLIELK